MRFSKVQNFIKIFLIIQSFWKYRASQILESTLCYKVQTFHCRPPADNLYLWNAETLNLFQCQKFFIACTKIWSCMKTRLYNWHFNPHKQSNFWSTGKYHELLSNENLINEWITWFRCSNSWMTHWCRQISPWGSERCCRLSPLFSHVCVCAQSNMFQAIFCAFETPWIPCLNPFDLNRLEGYNKCFEQQGKSNDLKTGQNSS